jgi:tetratricopeptide (TPR) repeat protein
MLTATGAVLSFDLKDYPGALADISKAIKIHEDNEEPYLIRAKVRMAMKNYQGAADDYSSVLFIDLDNTVVFAYRGLAQSYLANTDRMNADFNYAVKLEPK